MTKHMNITSAWCNEVKVETAKQVTILKGICVFFNEYGEYVSTAESKDTSLFIDGAEIDSRVISGLESIVYDNTIVENIKSCVYYADGGLLTCKDNNDNKIMSIFDPEDLTIKIKSGLRLFIN